MVTDDVRRLCKQQGLRGFEVPKVVVVENEQWTPENGLLTPALKVKRPVCKEKYERLLLGLVQKIEKMEGASVD